jgi:hypothetical protein
MALERESVYLAFSSPSDPMPQPLFSQFSGFVTCRFAVATEAARQINFDAPIEKRMIMELAGFHGYRGYAGPKKKR